MSERTIVWVVNGRKSLNGERFAVKAQTTASGPEAGDVFAVLECLTVHIRKECQGMEFPDSLRVTILPKEAA